MTLSNLRSRDYGIVAGLVALIHAGLFILDIFNSDAFLRADRAVLRFGAIRAIIESNQSYQTFVNEAVQLGNIGDYGIHAILYWATGRLGVIGFQIVLAVTAATCVVYIAHMLFPSRRFAIAAGLLYGLLPQSVAFPHQLVSEAIANPLLIIGVAALIRALRSLTGMRYWLLSGLLFGFAALVRPALILLPLLAALLLVWITGRITRPLLTGTLVLAGFAPFVLWSTFMLAQTGDFGLGKSNQDLGINLSTSVAKVLLSEGKAPANGKWPAWLPLRLSLADYLRYMRTYPGGFANLYAKSMLVMVTDSGIGRLYVDLVGFGAEARSQLQDPVSGWRAQLTNHGMRAMIVNGWRVAPATIVVGLVGAVVFALINVGLVVGYIVALGRQSILRSKASSLAAKWALAFALATPIYVVTTSLVVPYGASRLRSQGEFAWAMLACLGWAALAQWREKSVLTYPQVESSVA